MSTHYESTAPGLSLRRLQVGMCAQLHGHPPREMVEEGLLAFEYGAEIAGGNEIF